jgi:transposase
MSLKSDVTTLQQETSEIQSVASGQVFRNVQISKMFGVSEPTVINWIRAALEQKNQLDVAEYRGKWCIVHSPHNLSEMQILSEKGRKYRNKVPIKKVEISHLGQLRTDHTFELLHYLEYLYRIPSKFTHLRYRPSDLEKFFNTESTIDSKFLQAKLLSQDSQQTWTGHLKRDAMVNLTATSYSAPYVYKSYLQDVCQKRHVEQIKFIGMRQEESEIFRGQNMNFLEKNIPSLNLQTYTCDVDHDPLYTVFNKSAHQVNMVILLGEVFYNIGFFVKVVRNINRTLTPGDYIITNICLNNPAYHTDFEGFTSESSLSSIRPILQDLNLEVGEDFEWEHVYEDKDPTKKWYARTGSKKWFLTTAKEIHFHYAYNGVVKDFIWNKGTQIELANWKLWEEDFNLEAAKLGYNVVSWNTNMEQTEAMVLMQKVEEGTY